MFICQSLSISENGRLILKAFSYSDKIYDDRFCKVILSVSGSPKDLVKKAEQIEQGISKSIKEAYKTKVGELLVPSMHVDIEDNKKVYAYATISHGNKKDKVTFFYYLPCHTDYPKLVRGLKGVESRLMEDNFSFNEVVSLSKGNTFSVVAIEERVQKQDIEATRRWATRKMEDMLFSIENDYKNYMAEIKKEKTINSQQKYI